MYKYARLLYYSVYLTLNQKYRKHSYKRRSFLVTLVPTNLCSGTYSLDLSILLLLIFCDWKDEFLKDKANWISEWSFSNEDLVLERKKRKGRSERRKIIKKKFLWLYRIHYKDSRAKIWEPQENTLGHVLSFSLNGQSYFLAIQRWDKAAGRIQLSSMVAAKVQCNSQRLGSEL